jgi:putative membrane-bound dehydrogenase domain
MIRLHSLWPLLPSFLSGSYLKGDQRERTFVPPCRSDHPRFNRLAVLFLCLVSSPLLADAPPASGSQGLSPEVSATRFVISPEFKIELVGAEPDVIDPVAIAFDTDGKLWVVEYTDYPNGPGAGEPGLSRIRVLEDQNGDGKFENARIFADKLLFANGLMLWKGGAIVTTDGKVMYLKDTDGDGRADLSQIWFQGFQVENPQLRCNHPTLGIDNKVYIANGLRGGQIVPGADNPWGLDPNSPPVSISGRDFRFDPLTGEYEAIAGMGQFGMSFDDWGNRYLCNNRHPCMQVMLQDADLKQVPWLRPRQVYVDVSPAEFQSRLYPISRTWTTSNLHANQFTAACGTLIFRGTNLPADCYGNSFVCEPTANLVHRDRLQPVQSHYLALPQKEEKEFLASTDEWFRPVNLSIGPDGALYLCDMYRAVIEHPQFMPDELKNRPDLLWGTDKGRIWRISSSAPDQGKAPHPAKGFDKKSSRELVALLTHPNAWQRETAQRLLLERQDQSIEQDLAALVNQRESGWGASYALWLLQSLKLLKNEHIAAGLKHPQAQRFALQLAQTQFPDSREYLGFPERFLTDESFSTQDPFLWEQVLVHTRWKNFPKASEPVAPTNPRHAAILNIPEDGAHEWYCSMLIINAGEDLSDVCQELFQILRQGDKGNAPQANIGPAGIQYLIAALARRNQSDEISSLLTTVFSSSGSARERTWQRAVLQGLLDHLPNARSVLPTTVASLPTDIQNDYFACLNDVLRSFSDANDSEERSTDNIPLLILLPVDQILPVVQELAKSSKLDEVVPAIELLRKLPGNASAPVLVELVSTGTPQVRRTAITALTATTEGIHALLDLVEQKQVAVPEIDTATAKRLMSSKVKEIKERATALLQQAPPEDRVKVLTEYAAALTMASDPRRGQAIFEKNCATCHRINNIGINVGPDISDSATKTPEFLLTNILDPNRAVDNNYFSFTIVDTDGLVHTGVIANETSTAVTLRWAEGKEVTIPRDDIDMMKNNGVSLMPVGLERTISPQEMADLISFIKNWRYLDGQVPQEVIRERLGNAGGK